ncbi:MAG: hypothetical protein ACK5N4_09455 [Parabacteroides gordonii]|uniref:hypothetical protein n=1 Tax=Parabacteroides gordonii TaxID=574930 RepID=UPI003A85F91B
MWQTKGLYYERRIKQGKYRSSGGLSFPTRKGYFISDYDDFVYSSAEEIDELLPKAIAFIDAIEHLLSE